MDNCIFCKIIRKELPIHKIYENNDFLAFLDISQFTKGHTLIIPKKHYQFLWDMPEVGPYFDVVQKIGKHYIQLGFKYVNTLTFGMNVPHVHIHLVPHNGDDKKWNQALSGLETFYNKDNELTSKQGKELSKKLKLN